MATSKIFKKVPTVVPNRSGFNMSHNNFFSAPVGTLVPSMIDFLIPGDEIDLSSKLHVQLPPMATDFYGAIHAREEAFFVPARILFGGWKDFYVNPVDNTTNPSNIDGQLAKYLIGAKVTASSQADTPVQYFTRGVPDANDIRTPLSDIITTLRFDVAQNIIDRNFDYFVSSSSVVSGLSKVDAGTLADYLGFKVNTRVETAAVTHKIYSLFDKFVSIQNNFAAYFDNLTSINSINVQELVSNGRTYFDFTYRLGNTSNNYPYIDITYRFTAFYYAGSNTLDVRAKLLSSATYNFINGQYLPDPFWPISADVDVTINNILPFLAYHKVYDDWYRAPMIQQGLFRRNVANSSASTSVANMPWITSGANNKIYFTGDQLKFANGHDLFDLHQRNWQKDYFTSATPEPQAGEAASVKFDIQNESGEFTIASLRAANALQQWLEKNNIGGFRYGDMIYAQYGVYPSDAITDRAIYLGSSSTEVYNKSIYQQSGDGGNNTNNPFNAIGSKYSNPTGLGNGNYCNNYKVTEAGFVIKIFSLVPQAYYSTGVRRFFMHNDISDIAFPVLAGVGDQPIYGRELTDIYTGTGDDTVFGYVQRYADYKFIDDQVHGLLRDGQSLDSFALQRAFTSVPELGSEFLQIPREYLDQVSATDYKLSQYGCWVNCYNDYRKSSTLPAYSIPTLEDMKGHTVLVDKGGNYIA